jgi:hypothetical protein
MKKFKYIAVVDETYQFEDVCEDLALETKANIVSELTNEDESTVVIETYYQIPCLQTTFENVEGLCSLNYFKPE